VQAPAKYDLVINLKNAKGLGSRLRSEPPGEGQEDTRARAVMPSEPKWPTVAFGA
jgi:hypothetical protein